ncbi:MAG: hypothetical protein AAFR10_21560, partial [Pseudomonadota bacterium]
MKRPRVDTEASHRLISRRAALLGGVQLAFIGALGVRMQYLQVDQADQFRLLAEENRINIRLIPPARGLLFDRTGRALAENEQNYRVVMVKEDAGDVDEVLARLTQIVRIDPDDLERAREEISRLFREYKVYQERAMQQRSEGLKPVKIYHASW